MIELLKRIQQHRQLWKWFAQRRVGDFLGTPESHLLPLSHGECSQSWIWPSHWVRSQGRYKHVTSVSPGSIYKTVPLGTHFWPLTINGLPSHCCNSVTRSSILWLNTFTTNLFCEETNHKRGHKKRMPRWNHSDHQPCLQLTSSSCWHHRNITTDLYTQGENQALQRK